MNSLNLIKELYSILSLSQKRTIIYLQFLVLLMSLLEVMSILAVGPFIAAISDNSILDGDNFVGKIYLFIGIEDKILFLRILGIFVFILLLSSTFVSTLTIWKLSVKSITFGTDLSIRLFEHYMRQPWLFHTQNNTNNLINKLMNECNRVTMGIIQPTLQLNAKLMVAMSICIALFIYNPIVSIIVGLILSFSYFIIYKIVRNELEANGEKISNFQSKRIKSMAEGLGGIRDILLYGRQKRFIKNYSNFSSVWAQAYAKNYAIGLLPRYIIELIGLGTIIFLILYLLFLNNNTFSIILPTLSVFAIAGYKLLPAFQQVYASLSSLKSEGKAFYNLRGDLIKSSLNKEIKLNLQNSNLNFDKKISFDNVSFSYPRNNKTVLNNIDLSIKINSNVGIVGPSGSGKSTLIDLILGLIRPTKGNIRIDNETLTENNIAFWQKKIALVSQSIYLADSTIKENIAFGISKKNISEDHIKKVIDLASLNDFINSLDKGIDTFVGERGIQLSGGQIQRIGIARALYNNAEVLVLDEATSSLDGLTEKSIMSAVNSFYGKKTIIIVAHRLSTVKNCDKLYLMNNGKVVDSGSYEELIKDSEYFRELSKTS